MRGWGSRGNWFTFEGGGGVESRESEGSGGNVSGGKPERWTRVGEAVRGGGLRGRGPHRRRGARRGAQGGARAGARPGEQRVDPIVAQSCDNKAQPSQLPPTFPKGIKSQLPHSPYLSLSSSLTRHSIFHPSFKP